METIKSRIQELQASKTGDFIEDMNIDQEIRTLVRELKGEEPIELNCSSDDDSECLMCGS